MNAEKEHESTDLCYFRENQRSILTAIEYIMSSMSYFFGLAACLLFTATMSFSQCPSIAVTGPTGVTNLGDAMIFQVEVGVVGPQLRYAWTTDKGVITNGQGTSKITIQTTQALSGEKVTATAKIEGLPSGCADTASDTSAIYRPPSCGLADSWERLKPNDERGRLDLFFVELMNSPTLVGLVVLQITHEEKLDASNTRIRFILKHAKFRKFDKGMLWFALELGEESRTSLMRMPPNSELPCKGCVLIKGEHIQ